MAKKRVTKNVDLKVISEEHPEFISRIAQFFTRNRDTIGYMVVGVLILTAVFVTMNINKKSKEAEASIKLQAAIKQYQQDLAASSISFSAKAEDEDASLPEMQVKAKASGAFQSVFDNYPGTKAAENALYMVGVSQLNQGNYDEAIATFDNFLSTYPNDVLTPSGKLGKATAEFNAGKNAESLATLQGIEKRHPAFYLMDVVKFEEAKRFEALDKIEEARNNYNVIIEQYPDSQWKTMSEQAIDRLDKTASRADNKTA